MAEDRRQRHPSPGDPETVEIPRSRRALDFPAFHGRDAAGWLHRVHDYFTYYETQPQERLLITLCYLEGEHLDWPFGSMEHSAGCFTSWDIFVENYMAWFGRTPPPSTSTHTAKNSDNIDRIIKK
ncbi:hypothetical protein CJ030_MR7G010655 [Morella rubra]|uniref:Retrotransposon gag domain-containing protein n=1 Tax=Morella rubra TaxID=262757 RepID=A0A6A1UY95_9ROSI|nr:hypothetical protein CJ030_MR7G010655 [Morella rubra]